MQARRSEVDFQVLLPPLLDGVRLHIDVNKCGQVLRNLVSNALKFTPAGGSVKLISSLVTSVVEPSTMPDDALVARNDMRFRFEVHDTGPGISEVSGERKRIEYACR